jgi:hypothetical protein
MKQLLDTFNLMGGLYRMPKELENAKTEAVESKPPCANQKGILTPRKQQPHGCASRAIALLCNREVA